MPAGKIKLKFEPLPHNLFRVEVEKSSVQNDLAASDYVEFSPDLEFAGLSKRGKLLSVPKSKGPARIGGYPLRVEATGAGWIEINDRKTLLLTTDKPDIIVVCNPNCHWSGPQSTSRSNTSRRGLSLFRIPRSSTRSPAKTSYRVN